MYKDDLKKIISWSGHAQFKPNLFWKNDHALKHKKSFLEKTIPGIKSAEFIAVDKGKVVGLFNKDGLWQPLPNFPKENKKLKNFFLSLLKLRLSEQKLNFKEGLN